MLYFYIFLTQEYFMYGSLYSLLRWCVLGKIELYVRLRTRTQCFLIVAFPSTSRSLYSYHIAGVLFRQHRGSRCSQCSRHSLRSSQVVVSPVSRDQSDGANGTEGKGKERPGRSVY